MLEADYIFLHVLLGSGEPGRLKRALAEILRYQNEDGSWSIYPGGPGNISLAVKCYLACKLMGMGASDPRLVKCRSWVLEHGGVVECNTFAKIYLCSLGQYDYSAVPAVPPEIVLFPNWFYFNIYEISSWSRSILVPLAIIYAKKPFRKIPSEQGIDELFVGGRSAANLRLPINWKSPFSWRNFFLALDRVIHLAEAAHIRPYADEGPHTISNGIFLRSDLHTLFDRGYITITNDYHVAVSRRIRDEFSNGREYYALEGKALQITPQSAADRPSKEFLEWHQNNCFRNQ